MEEIEETLSNVEKSSEISKNLDNFDSIHDQEEISDITIGASDINTKRSQFQIQVTQEESDPKTEFIQEFIKRAKTPVTEKQFF